MKKRNRMLAILLAFTMVLTFMPMLAFAEGEDADADPQATEATVEETDAEALEEMVNVVEEQTAEEQVELTYDAKEAETPVPTKGVFHHVGDLWGWAGDNQIEDNGQWFGDDNSPNSVDVTFSNGETKTYIVNRDETSYFLNGDTSKEEVHFHWDYNVRLKEGKNTVDFFMDGENGDYKIGTVEITGVKSKTEKLVYTQAKPLEAELTEWGYADYMGEGDDYMAQFEGDTVQVKAYAVVESDNGDSETPSISYVPYEAIYKCKKQAIDEGDAFYGFFLEKLISGEFANPTLEIRFWDDQEESPWKAGSTHEVTATYEGFEADKKLVVKVTGNAAPHAHVAGNVENVVVTEATCTKAGSYDEVTYCKECGQEMSRVRKTSNALGHSIHKIAAKAATCQETGVKAHYECQNCGGMFKDAKGKKTTTVKALTIKKKKHNLKKKSGEYLKSAATCTKPAVYYYSCTMCGSKGTKTYKSGKALGHKFENSVTKATPTKNGSIGQKCTVCGKKGKGKVIPKASKIAVVKKYKKKGVPAAALAGGAFIEIKNAKGKKIAASEYDIVFNNNEEAGKGSATITFKGDNYEGSKVVSYKIVK